MFTMRKKVFMLFFVLILLVYLISLNAFCGVDDPRPIHATVDGMPNVDPHTGTGSAITFFFINTYDTLIMYDLEGNIVPLLAESWEISDDNLSYTFKLKKGVKFHDGSELKASDVVFSLNRLSTMQVGFSYIFKNRIKKVEAIDDYTVRFDLVQPFGAFIDTLCRLYIVNEKLIMAHLNMKSPTYNYGEEYGDFSRDYLLTNDAGSGPYKFRELVPQNYLVLDQFKDYHIPFSKDAPTSVKFIRNTEAMTVRTMLNQRELEVSDTWQTAESLDAISKIPGVSIGQYTNCATQHIVFNCSLPPTDDENFRKALACIIDYDTIVKNIFPGSKPAIGPCNALTPGSGTQHSANPYKYDIEKAKEYLALSKYANQLDKYPVEFFHNTSAAAQEKIALLILASAKKIGINITLTGAPYATLGARVAGKETTPNMQTSSQLPWYFDAASTFLACYTSDNVGTVANPFWILDKTLDQMTYDAIKIVDKEKRYAEYAKIEKYILDHCYGAYIADITERLGYQSQYVDFPADDMFVKTGKLSFSAVGRHYWYHDWSVYTEKKPK